MMGFRHSDPQRPSVLGSLFTGTTGSGGKVENTAFIIDNDKYGGIVDNLEFELLKDDTEEFPIPAKL